MEKSFSLRNVIDIDELQSIQDSFAKAVGISSVILSPEGEPLTKFTNPTGFCSLIQSTNKGKERCFRSFIEMGKNALGSEKPEIFYCFAHGGHFVAPIIIDGEHKGTMFAGQFIPERFSFEQLKNLEEIAVAIDLEPGLLREKAEKMRMVGEDVVRKYSTLLFKIVETIARRGAQTAELSRVNDALERSQYALELRFRDIAGAMSDWVWEIDADARYTYCSEKVKDVLGYSGEEMIGKTPFDLMIPDEMAGAGAEFAEIVRERRPFRDMENWFRTRDRRSVCMLTSGVPILNDAGEVLGYRGVDSDITERKKAEKALQKERDRAQHYLDVAGVMFVIITADRKVNLINRKGCEILGYEDEGEITGKDWFDNFVPERLKDEVARVFGLLIAGEIEPVEYYENPVLTKHGEERIVAWHNTLLIDEQGGIYATMASGEDITERKRAEDALKDRVEFEKIITAISTSFINLTPDEIDAGIEDALGSIGEFAGVDRSYVFRLFDDGTKMDNTHEWCAEGIVPQIEDLKGLSVAGFPWFLERLNRFETVHIPSVADLPPEADAEKEILQSGDILSAILVPMVYGRTLVGFVGFDSVKQEKGWSYENISLLKMVGEIFVNGLERRYALDALRSSEAKFRVIIEKNPLGSIIVDKERKIKEVNDAAAALIGRPREEIIGRICHEFVCPRAQNDCPIYDHGLTFDHKEAILLSKDRGKVHIEKTVTRIEIDGEPMLLEMFSDITEHKAANEQIKKKAYELEKFNKLAVGRELKMIELKKEINALVDDAGKGPRYKIVGDV